MPQPYKIRTTLSWNRTLADLQECFHRWGIRPWAADHVRGTNGANVRYQPKGSDTPIDLYMDRQATPEDNLRVLYLAVDAMRLNEARGIEDTIRQAYAALAAPVKTRDPYEVLGVRSDTDLEDIEAIYRSKAKRAHPDAGGSTTAMQELNEAIEAIRKEKP